MEVGEFKSAMASVYRPVVMSEGEMLTRAREAFITATNCWRWRARKMRAGKLDHLLGPVMTALHDLDRPMSLIVSDRDEATAALLLKTSPGLSELDGEAREAVAGALLSAVRMGRRG